MIVHTIQVISDNTNVTKAMQKPTNIWQLPKMQISALLIAIMISEPIQKISNTSSSITLLFAS